MRKKISRARGCDYYFDEESWYQGDREKSTIFIGSFDLKRPIIIEEEVGSRYIYDTFVPRFVVGKCAFAINDLGLIVRKEEGVLEIKIEDFSQVTCSITGPIEVVYQELNVNQ